VARLYPKALGSLFIISYNSQVYGGGIRPRLHTGIFPELQAGVPVIYPLGTDRVENTVSNSSFIVGWISVAAGSCLQSRSIAAAVYSCLLKSCLAANVVLLFVSRSLP
jgi:hypothetical protein